MRAMMGWAGLAALAIGGAARATEAPPPAIDNERVMVWSVRLTPGQSGPATSHDLDTVIMFVEGGRIRTVTAAGKVTVATRKFGDAVFVPRGTDAVDTLVSGGPANEIVVALKDHPEPPIPNTTGLPPAFPRPGSVKVLENDRVVVWHYDWDPKKASPMHFHDKDVVVAYRYDGTITSVTPDGKVTVNPSEAGQVRFTRGNRSHYELVTTARQSGVMMELKP